MVTSKIATRHGVVSLPQLPNHMIRNPCLRLTQPGFEVPAQAVSFRTQATAVLICFRGPPRHSNCLCTSATCGSEPTTLSTPGPKSAKSAALHAKLHWMRKRGLIPACNITQQIYTWWLSLFVVWMPQQHSNMPCFCRSNSFFAVFICLVFIVVDIVFFVIAAVFMIGRSLLSSVRAGSFRRKRGKTPVSWCQYGWISPALKTNYGETMCRVWHSFLLGFP